nr:hypothetical protein [Tanacetum cinerariifolium]
MMLVENKFYLDNINDVSVEELPVNSLTNDGCLCRADIGKSSGVPDEGASDLVGESMKGGGLGGGASDKTGEGGDSIGGSGGKGI